MSAVHPFEPVLLAKLHSLHRQGVTGCINLQHGPWSRLRTQCHSRLTHEFAMCCAEHPGEVFGHIRLQIPSASTRFMKRSLIHNAVVLQAPRTPANTLHSWLNFVCRHRSVENPPRSVSGYRCVGEIELSLHGVPGSIPEGADE